MPSLCCSPEDLVGLCVDYADTGYRALSPGSPILRGTSLSQGLDLIIPVYLPKPPKAALCIQNRMQSLSLEAFKAGQSLKEAAAFKNQDRANEGSVEQVTLGLRLIRLSPTVGVEIA